MSAPRFALILAALALLAGPVSAATVTLHPTGQGYSNQGTPVPAGAGTNWDRVNDQTGNAATGAVTASDGDSTYVNMATNAWTDAYALATSNIPSGSTVTQLDVHAVVRGFSATTATFTLLYRVGTTNTLGTATNVASVTYADLPNSFTGLSLAESDWSTLQIGITISDANPDVYVTQMWVVVTYTPPAATLTIGNGASEPGNSSITNGQTAALDTFTLATSAGTATVTAVTVNLTAGSAALASISINSAAACNGTTYGTLSSGLVDGNNAISLATNISATTTASTYYVCVTATTVGANTNVTGNVASVTASGYASIDNDTTNATVTVTPSASITIGNGASEPANSSITVGETAALDTFTLQASAGTGTVTVVTVNLTAGAAALASISINSAAACNGTTYGTLSSGLVNGNNAISLATNISATTTASTYYVCVTATTVVANTNVTGNVASVTASGFSSTDNDTTNATVTVTPPRSTTVGAASAVVDSCTQITVSAPFTNDSNTNSTTTISRGATSTGPWTAVCSGLNTISPRVCVDSGRTGATSYYYQVDFTDADGVVGTDPQVVGPYTTPVCAVNGTTAGLASALNSSCSSIIAFAAFTGDDNGTGSTDFYYNTSNTWPGTLGCTASGPSPRQCTIQGLTSGNTYWVRATFNDADGVAGTNPTLGASTGAVLPACGADVKAPTITLLVPRRGATVSGADVFKVQVWDAVNLAAANPVQWYVDSGAYSATGVAASTLYACGTKCTVYEITVPAQTAGLHTVFVRAADAAGNNAYLAIPFRATVAKSGTGQILRRTASSQTCLDCHNLKAHSSQSTSDKYGNWATDCATCHTPHQTTNIFLVRQSIQTPNSGTKPVDFRSTTGVAANSYATASGNGVNVCEVCHTRTTRAKNNAATNWATHYSGRCTDCHKHDSGFGGGESGGNDDCLGCHTFGMVVTEASRTTTYHHVLEVANKLVSGVTTYPTSSAPTVATADQDKTCVQCHADHNVFRPDVNASNTLGRGANLRTRIANGPPTGNPPAASAPGDSAPGYYTNRDQDPAFAAGGICLSCHVNAQTKNVADQKTYSGDPGTTSVIVSSIANFGASAHGYTTVSGQITNGSSAFTVPCSKCHSDSSTSYQNGAYKFQLHASANRRLLNPLGITTPADPLEENFCFRCHSSTTDTTPGGGPAKAVANRDYYNQVPMSARAEKVFQQFTVAGTYPWDHPIQGTGALHDPVEGAAANDGTIGGAQRHVQCEDCHNPHATAAIASGSYVGSITAFAAGAAPAADTLTDSTKAWTVNALKGFTAKMTSGTRAGLYSTIYANTATTLSVEFGATVPAVTDTYIIVNWGVTSLNATWAGNKVSPAMRDVWGVAPTFPAQPTPPNWNDSGGTLTAAEILGQYNAIGTWGRTSAATLQGQICIKCHSAYAYGASPPNTPSGAPNSTAAAWVNTAGAATAQSDVANQFNPNNLSHHAVFARGNNQPIKSGVASNYNTNWPKFISGAGITVSTSGTSVTLAGTTWPVTLVPGWFINIGSAAPAQGATTWYEVTGVTSTTVLTVDRTAGTLSGQAFLLTAGLGNNFVPPFGPWSTLSCSDCHTSRTMSDPFGPHGSANKWLLRGGEAQSFMFYNGAASTPTNVLAVTYTPDSYNLCLNCHRRDVYGDYNYTAPTYNLYPRQEHPIDKGKNHSLTYRSNWGIPCMNCHGGARIGQIHGSNLGRGSGGTGGSYSGKRLLAGSSWYAVTRSGTAAAGACWTKGATDSVDNCGHTHGGIAFESGTNGRANYDYDSTSP